MKTIAILVAAGRGERMAADRPKAFLPLQGRSLLQRSAAVLALAPSIDRLVAVVPERELEVAREMLASIDKPVQVTAGGARRQDSVVDGLRQLPDGFDGIVLIHDAARPLVSVALVEAVVAAAKETGAALPVLGLVDTVKRVRDGRVVETLDRSELGAAQTPQGFRLALLVRAYEEAFRHRLVLTDEAMAVEHLGEPVAVVAGEPTNRKITTPDDLLWAERVLLARGRA